MRLLVCGGRNYSDKVHLFSVMDSWMTQCLLRVDPIEIIITGGAPGADALACFWAQERRVAHDEYRADWERYGKSAGPVRNAQMLLYGKPSAVIAFPGGRGTADMCAKARAAGVPVYQGDPLEMPWVLPHE